MAHHSRVRTNQAKDAGNRSPSWMGRTLDLLSTGPKNSFRSENLCLRAACTAGGVVLGRVHISFIMKRVLTHGSGGFREKVSVNEIIELPVQDGLRISGFYLRSVVFDELVGMKHVASDLATESSVDHRSAL